MLFVVLQGVVYKDQLAGKIGGEVVRMLGLTKDMTSPQLSTDWWVRKQFIKLRNKYST